jgi:hypothetical protein
MRRLKGPIVVTANQNGPRLCFLHTMFGIGQNPSIPSEATFTWSPAGLITGWIQVEKEKTQRLKDG